MNELVTKAINEVNSGKISFCKFLSANDSGETGGHQCGILVSITASELFFTLQEISDNHICKKTANIKWQDDFVTPCNLTWYESKKELRIRGFGRGFDLLNPDATGDLFVLVKDNSEEFQGYFFSTEDDIDDFLDAFALTPAETNRIINKKTEFLEESSIAEFISSLKVDFPLSSEMSAAARMIQAKSGYGRKKILDNPDDTLLRWTDIEYRLFKALEQARYGKSIKNGFDDVEEFITLANTVLNRRKSRAGKSLEHHLSAIFDENRIEYQSQAKTEGNKKPDFLFPSEDAYHDASFSIDKLCTLAAKTTCKDRWRQILNEADRLRDENKYLCTMQQGISRAQMDEMQAERVVLVVPKAYIRAYPKDKQDRIWTIKRFVEYVKRIEEL